MRIVCLSEKKLLAIRTTSLSPRSPPPPPVFLSHPSFGSSELSISTSRADPSVAVVFSSSSFLTTGAREKPSLTNSCGLSSASWTYASTRSTRKRRDGRCESAPVSSISTARFFRRGPHVASGWLGRRGGLCTANAHLALGKSPFSLRLADELSLPTSS